MPELFQCFDEDMIPTQVLPRDTVHREGHWHQSMHCWVVDVDAETKKPYILVQKRHPGKDTFPNLLDITAAGHLSAGETVKDALREVKEELGLTIDPARLTFLGLVKEGLVEPPDIIDNEFCFVYLYESNLPLEAYELQPDEVVGLYRIELRDFVDLMNGRKETVSAIGLEYNEPKIQPISADDFVTHTPEYFRFLTEILERHYMQNDPS